MKKKILQLGDVQGWAIDRLSSAIVSHNPQFEWRRIFLHPRDLEKGLIDLKEVTEAIEWCDAVDAQYWRVLSQLLEKIPALREKPIMLTHHNEKNLLSADWKDVKIHIAKTKWSQRRLQEAGYKNVLYIPNSFNPDVFKFNNNWPIEEKAVGFAGRVVDWKGIREIAKACRELNVPFYIMGKQEDQAYLESFPREDFDNINWSFFNYPDEGIKDFYKAISCYVCNSAPEREVGPLGVIEAMASGVPVVSTPAGIVADIGKNRENMIVVPFGDYNALKDAIQEVLETPQLANDIRNAGHRTIKNYCDPIMARDYTDAIFQLIGVKDKPLVSVIVPATFDRREQIEQILVGLNAQDYPSMEVVIVWDELQRELEPFSDVRFPVKHLFTCKEDGYNLAMARNLGVIEACGEILIFCDSRFRPEPGSIQAFVEDMQVHEEYEKVWLFGDKMHRGLSSGKKSFVENWSCIRRRHLIDAGMFNERINEYGGMSQELRSRFLAQDFQLEYCPEIKAEELIKSGSRREDRRESMLRMKVLLHKLGFKK